MIGQFGKQFRRVRSKADAVRIPNGVAVLAVANEKHTVISHVRPARACASIGQSALARERIASEHNAFSIQHHQRAMQRRKGALLHQSGGRGSQEVISKRRMIGSRTLSHPAKCKARVKVAKDMVVGRRDDGHQMLSRTDYCFDRARIAIRLPHSQAQAHRRHIKRAVERAPAFYGSGHYFGRIGFQFERKSEWIKSTLQRKFEGGKNRIGRDFFHVRKLGHATRFVVRVSHGRIEIQEAKARKAKILQHKYKP